MGHSRHKEHPKPDGILVILTLRGEDGSVRSVAGVFPKGDAKGFQQGDRVTAIRVVE